MLCALAIAAILSLAGSDARAQEDDQLTMIEQIKETIASRGGGPYLTPVPGSRSNIIAIDASSSLYFFLERGSIRGSAISEFYEVYESGDMEAAYSVFLGNAILLQRVTDYGWNGLGVPMTTDAGSEINDVLFKDVGGAFSRATEISDEDLENYIALLRAILSSLEQG